MAELTYEDYKERINIQEVLQDAGYHFNRKDGMRYPSYVRLDSDGRRIRGDKFIVTANGLCCFHPPERKNYNVISFIKEHPDMFAEYAPGMSTDRLVNLVCHRLLNQPIVERQSKILNPQKDVKPFDISEYDVQTFERSKFETQKPFYPYFKNRGIDLNTQRAFADNFVLATRHRDDGRKFTNLSFPMSIPNKDGIVGLEERSRPNAEGRTAYKGKAAGTNSSDGMWIANLSGKPLADVSKVLWFESAYDAMAYYQLHPQHDAVFISTGGNPGDRQFAGMLDATPQAEHHLCFDRDAAGQSYCSLFNIVKDNKSPDTKVVIDSADERYKDWNDQLMDKPANRKPEEKERENEQEQRPRFHR
jgi:hypothetical protein